jgi:3-oxoacyl-[acyl-carrier protein] reductase
MIQYDFSGRTAVVTGGAKGIGLGIAQKLAGAGAGVAVWDLNPDSLRNDAAGKAFEAILSVDVTEPASVEQAVQDTLAQLGVIDILVNNAGVAGPTLPTWEYPLHEWDRVIATDLTSVFLCCRAVVPVMMESGRGRIVNVASVAGKEGNANACAYSAAKAGVIALTKSLGKELAQSGIIVNSVAPAMVQTDLLGEMTPEYIAGVTAKIPMGRFGTIEENADMVAWLCSDACSFATGAVFDVSGGRATY